MTENSNKKIRQVQEHFEDELRKTKEALEEFSKRYATHLVNKLRIEANKDISDKQRWTMNVLRQEMRVKMNEELEERLRVPSLIGPGC